jgi:hypothetical protein
MIDPDPKKRPQSGGEVLGRLDDLGYSPITLASRDISADLSHDLKADGLVLVGDGEPEVVELTEPVASPGPSTTYVYAGGAAPNEATAVDEVDIEASRRKLGFLETASPRVESRPKEQSPKKPLLSQPVVEKVRTPPNGSPRLEDLPRIGEAVHAPIEVTDSQMIGEIEELDSQDLEMIGIGPEKDTEEQPIPLPGSRLEEPAQELEPPLPAPSSTPPSFTPAPTLLSAAELSDSKPIGGVQTLPVEHGERSRPVYRENPPVGGFKPKGSWPTEDLVLPSKQGGWKEDSRRVPTQIIRARSPFGEIDGQDRPGILSGRDTEIIRARGPSGRITPDALPVDRSPLVIDPAEGAVNVSGEILVRPRRSLIPLAAGLAILTIGAAAIALPRLDVGDEILGEPVQIEALPAPVQPLDALPEGDAPEKEPEVAKTEVAKSEPIEAKAEEQKPKENARDEVPDQVPEEEPEEVLPEGDEPAAEKVVEKPRKRERKKPARKRSSVRAVSRPEPKKAEPRKAEPRKAEPKKEQPDKLEKGTLIDAFEE